MSTSAPSSATGSTTPCAVTVRVANGYVTLEGTLPSTDIPKVYNGVMGLRGVVGVNNQLTGGNPSSATSNGPTASASRAR